MDKHIATLEAIRANGFDFGFENDDYAALDAAIALMRGQSWQPIETAPKDGGVFLVYLPNERKKVQTAWKTENGIMAIGGVFSFDMSAPTHWMPLPAPPKDPADEQ